MDGTIYRRKYRANEKRRVFGVDCALLPGANHGDGNMILDHWNQISNADRKQMSNRRIDGSMLDQMAARSDKAKAEGKSFVTREIEEVILAKCGPLPSDVKVDIPKLSIVRPPEMDRIAHGNPPFHPLGPGDWATFDTSDEEVNSVPAFAATRPRDSRRRCPNHIAG